MGRQLSDFDGFTYTYNESGIRTSKTSNGVTTKYYLNGTNIIEQTDGTNTLYFYYDRSNEVIGFNYADNDYIYVKNQQGDITDIANSDGEVVASYAYDPWGKVISITGDEIIGNLNPFRYRSYYYDSDIQMYYLQSRYYDPEVCRFINCDDVNYIGASKSELSYNAFAYCGNDPVNNHDCTGNASANVSVNVSYRYYTNEFAYKEKGVSYFTFDVYTIKDFKKARFGYEYFIAMMGVYAKNLVSIDLTPYDSRVKNKINEKNVKSNKSYLKEFVKADLTGLLTECVISNHKSVYGKNIKLRTKMGIEYEILLHIYMYCFDLDRDKKYARSETIEVDSGKSAIAIDLISDGLLIKRCKKAICSGKQDKFTQTMLKRFA